MKNDNKKKVTNTNLDKLDRVLETHYFVIYLTENNEEKITSTRTEMFPIPFDLEYEMVNEIELFGDIKIVPKDTYAEWIGTNRTHNGETVVQKGKVYDVITLQNGRVILDLGKALYGWIRPKDYKIIEVAGELDYENGTIH